MSKLTPAEYKEYLKKVAEIHYSMDSMSIHDPEEYQEWHFANFAMEEMMGGSLKIMLQGKDMEGLKNIAQSFDMSDENYAECLRRMVEPYVNAKDLDALKGKSPAEMSSAYMAMYDSFDDEKKSKSLESLKMIILSQIHMDYMGTKEAFFSLIDKIEKVNGGSYEGLVLDDSKYDFKKAVLDNQSCDHPRMNDAIQELKGDDEEYNEILDEINEKILVDGEKSSVADVSKYAEAIASSANHYSADLGKDYYDEVPEYQHAVSRQGGSYKFKQDASPLDRSKAVEKVYSDKIEISEEKKESMKSICEFLDKNGFLDNVPYDTSTLILSNQKELMKAIGTKDKGEILKAYKNYKKAEELTDKALGMMEHLTKSKIIPSNQSLARVANVPAKYRHDIFRVSNLTGFIQIAGLAKRVGVSFDSILENPAKKIAEVWGKNTGIKTKLNQALYCESPLSKLFHTMDNAKDSEKIPYFKEAEFAIALQRGVTGFAIFSSDTDLEIAETTLKLSTLEEAMLLPYAANYGSRIFDYALEDDFELPSQLLEKMIIMEPSDRDIAVFDPNSYVYSRPNEKFNLDLATGKITEPFTIQSYFKDKKTSPYEISLRILEVEKNMEDEPYDKIGDNVNSALDNVLQALKDVSKTKSLDKVITALSTRKTDEIKDSDLKNVKLSASVAKNLRATSTSDMNPLRNALKDSAALKKEYYSHNILARHIFSSYRNMKDTLVSVRGQFTSKGFNGDAFDLALDSINKKNEDALNLSVRNMAETVLRHEEEVRKPLVLDEEEVKTEEDVINDDLNNAKIITKKDFIENDQPEIK